MTTNNMTVASICGDVRWPETRVCSGHGDCIILDNIYQCVCDIGWSGHGDALNRIGYDCNVHRHTITIIHWITLIYGVLLVIYFTISIYQLRRRQLARITPTASIINNNPPPAVPVTPIPITTAAATAAVTPIAASGVESDVVAMTVPRRTFMTGQASIDITGDTSPFGINITTPQPASSPVVVVLTHASPAIAAAPATAVTPPVTLVIPLRRVTSSCWRVTWDAPQYVIVIATIYAINEVIYFTIRLSQPDAIIATHGGIAAGWIISGTLFFCFAAYFLWIVVQSVISPLRLSAVHALQVAYLTRLMKWSLAMVPLVSALPLVWVTGVMTSVNEAALTAAVCCMAASCYCVVFIIRIFGARLIVIIDTSMAVFQRHRAHAVTPTKDKRLASARKRIIILVRAWTALGIMGGGAFLASGIWPWLRTQTAYLLPATWLIAGMAITFGTVIFTRAGASISPSSDSDHNKPYAAHQQRHGGQSGDVTPGGGAISAAVNGNRSGGHTPQRYSTLDDGNGTAISSSPAGSASPMVGTTSPYHHGAAESMRGSIARTALSAAWLQPRGSHMMAASGDNTARGSLSARPSLLAPAILDDSSDGAATTAPTLSVMSPPSVYGASLTVPSTSPIAATSPLMDTTTNGSNSSDMMNFIAIPISSAPPPIREGDETHEGDRSQSAASNLSRSHGAALESELVTMGHTNGNGSPIVSNGGRAATMITPSPEPIAKRSPLSLPPLPRPSLPSLSSPSTDALSQPVITPSVMLLAP